MKKTSISNYIAIIVAAVVVTACSIPQGLVPRKENNATPDAYAKGDGDSINSAKIRWKEFFTDQYLVGLIDTALSNNQELNITLQEINIAQQEVRARKGEYLPFLNAGALAEVEHTPRYTRYGAVDESTDIEPGRQIPNPYSNFVVGLNASWEVDVWKKLRNAKKSAMLRYFATVEGRNFMVTNLIAEIASSYYELLALDNQLSILKQNIEIQTNALHIVEMEKQAAKVTELAVRRFEAEVLKNQSRIYDIQQKIIETENRINFLVGRFPQPIQRNSHLLTDLVPTVIKAGVPSQLLQNRPDIRQAERELGASKVDVQVAKANFYPSLRITGGVGFQAFRPEFLIRAPESLLASAAGELMAPLINRNAIRAFYYSANAKQLQSVYNYERTILNAYIEVANQMSNISNLEQSYALKSSQVAALNQSIAISTNLFKSARADYMEVLMTQRDALEARFELIETKMQQMHAMVYMYQQLGGGWE